MSALSIPRSVIVGLRCRCPNCGEGCLFKGFLALAKSCDHCGLDLSFAEPADGPAFFAMTGVGILVTTAWAMWAVAAQPPIWAQLVVALSALIGGCLSVLRPIKAWLVAEQFLHKAQEARWSSLGQHGEGGFVIDRRKASER